MKSSRNHQSTKESNHPKHKNHFKLNQTRIGREKQPIERERENQTEESKGGEMQSIRRIKRGKSAMNQKNQKGEKCNESEE
ncbi:hypothetical protein MTR_4g064877 [Medicago truncatula]|uniref:Uncharacterized protein n=1 Tax=Medicago truncatula TaxID=3880 RepID=A0A072ULA6_MEDTR|nr:hypothetical protein MTR_4g064877 [Medicago truncatula]